MSKINLLYDATCLAPHLVEGTGTGIYTVAFEVLKELCHRKGFNIQLYCPDKLYTLRHLTSRLKLGLEKAPSEIKSLKIFENKDLEKIDVFFSPMYTFPREIVNQQSIQKYLFLHDTIPLLYPEYWKGQPMAWYHNMVQSLNKNDFYFVNSQSTQNDFMKYSSGITKDNSCVTLLAFDNSFKPQKSNIKKILKKYNLPTDKKYVFSLCTLEPRKNLIRAVKTFIEFIRKNKINDMVFILGGGNGIFSWNR